jgi:hypothetical protein
MRNPLLATALVLWIVTLAAAVYTHHANQKTISREAILGAARDLMPRPIALTQKPVAAAVYERIAAALPQAKNGVEITASPTHIQLSASKPKFYEAWLLATASVIAQAPQFKWEIINLCAGKKCPGRVFTAHLSASYVHTEIR